MKNKQKKEKHYIENKRKLIIPLTLILLPVLLSMLKVGNLRFSLPPIPQV
jgi:hypothetical protein